MSSSVNLPPELSSSTGSSASGFASNLSSTAQGYLGENTTLKVVGIIIIVALLGFNIFLYLGNVVDTAGEVVKPLLQRIVSLFGYTITETAKKTVEVSADGTKLGVDVVAGTLKSAIDVVEDVGEGISGDDEVPPVQKKKVKSGDVKGASLKRSKTNKAQNFCYVGTDRGNRTCIPVGSDSDCFYII